MFSCLSTTKGGKEREVFFSGVNKVLSHFDVNFPQQMLENKFQTTHKLPFLSDELLLLASKNIFCHLLMLNPSSIERHR